MERNTATHVALLTQVGESIASENLTQEGQLIMYYVLTWRKEKPVSADVVVVVVVVVRSRKELAEWPTEKGLLSFFVLVSRSRRRLVSLGVL